VNLHLLSKELAHKFTPNIAKSEKKKANNINIDIISSLDAVSNYKMLSEYLFILIY